MRLSLLTFATVALAGTSITTSTTTTTTTPNATPIPPSICTNFPYDALLPLRTNAAAQSWCSKYFPVSCTGGGREVNRKKIVERTANPGALPTTLVKRAPKGNPTALLSTLEALGKEFASTACGCIETPTPC